MDAHYCRLLLKSLTQLEGALLRDKFSVAFFLTDSLHQFA